MYFHKVRVNCGRWHREKKNNNNVGLNLRNRKKPIPAISPQGSYASRFVGKP